VSVVFSKECQKIITPKIIIFLLILLCSVLFYLTYTDNWNIPEMVKTVIFPNKKEIQVPAHTNPLGMEFVYIPPGEFLMGSRESEVGRFEDENQHQVFIFKGFYIQTTEVTQGQWKKIMGNNPSKFQNCGDNCPVENVSWEDAQEFIKRLNQKEGKEIYRLPTEAEWEFSARAGSQKAFANGDITQIDCEPDSNLDKMGWYCGNADNKTHEVARKSANAWGLYDMHGNVWEWCQDLYGDYPVYAVTVPTGSTEGTVRVVRGGGWVSVVMECRSAKRDGNAPVLRFSDLGFRLLIPLGETP